jgi:hypothetical protein
VSKESLTGQYDAAPVIATLSHPEPTPQPGDTYTVRVDTQHDQAIYGDGQGYGFTPPHTCLTTQVKRRSNANAIPGERKEEIETFLVQLGRKRPDSAFPRDGSFSPSATPPTVDEIAAVQDSVNAAATVSAAVILAYKEGVRDVDRVTERLREHPDIGGTVGFMEGEIKRAVNRLDRYWEEITGQDQ